MTRDQCHAAITEIFRRHPAIVEDMRSNFWLTRLKAAIDLHTAIENYTPPDHATAYEDHPSQYNERQ